MYHFFNIHGAVKGVLHCRESSSLQITHTSGQEGSQGVTLIQQRQPWGCSRSPQDVTQAQPSKTGPRIPNQERRMTANATQWSSLASRGWNNSSGRRREHALENTWLGEKEAEENDRFDATAMNRLKKSFCKGEIEMLPNPPAAHKDAYQFIWRGLPFLCWFPEGKASSLWRARAIQAFTTGHPGRYSCWALL